MKWQVVWYYSYVLQNLVSLVGLLIDGILVCTMVIQYSTCIVVPWIICCACCCSTKLIKVGLIADHLNVKLSLRTVCQALTCNRERVKQIYLHHGWPIFSVYWDYYRQYILLLMQQRALLLASVWCIKNEQLLSLH